MSDWQHRIELKDLHDKYQNREITILTLAREILSRIKLLQEEIEKKADPTELLYLEKLLEIEDLFEELSLDTNADIEDYDFILNKFYDWADTKLDDLWNGKTMCWINTL